MKLYSLIFLLLFLFVYSCKSTPEVDDSVAAADCGESNNTSYTCIDGVGFKQTDRGVVLIFEKPVNFSIRGSAIASQYNEIFSLFNDFVKKNSGSISRIVIEGHTDSVGSDSYNQRLSEDRALSALNKAAGLGVSRTLMRSSALSDSIPEYWGDNAYKNRRVEFVILGSNADITKYDNYVAKLNK